LVWLILINGYLYMTNVTITKIQETLRSWVGLSGRSPNLQNRELHAKTILPNDTTSFALSYFYGGKRPNGTMMIPSTCALVTQAYLREVWGLHTSDLDTGYQYQIGQAFSDVAVIAKKYNAWVTDKNELSEIPGIGDCLQIGDNGSGGAYHFLNVVDYDAATGAIISVDGGQVDGSWITERNRLLVTPEVKFYQNSAWLVDPDKPYKTDGSPNGRVITGKVSAKKLAETLGLTL